MLNTSVQEIQNEIISVCNELIMEQLVDSINRSRFFFVLADETTDISCQEQLSLCARYLNDDFAIEKCFFQFVPITDLSGKNLASTIITKLSQFGINVSKMRDQGYNETAAMSGKLNGAQAHIREIIPTALYVHCAAHNLNLAVSNSCDLPPIRNCMGTIASVYNFFNAPKRQNVLRSTITTILPTTNAQQIESIQVLGKFYQNDLTKSPEELVSELKLWYRKLSRLNVAKKATDALNSIKECCPDAFPNIFTLIAILLTLPVTTCTSERSFSTLRRLKTYLRNTTGTTRMNGLALLNIYRAHSPCPGDVIDRFSDSSRRLNMSL